MLKLLLAASLALAPATSATPQAVELSPIPRIICRVAKGYISGSAVKIGQGLLLSVKHVTNHGPCEVDGAPMKVLYTSPTADFSILSDKRAGQFIPVDCEGFKQGRHYAALGHARGVEDIIIVPLLGTGVSREGYAILIGIFTAQPGQSGGAIVDVETGKVVGMVNAAEWETGRTFSVELKGTSICGANIA